MGLNTCRLKGPWSSISIQSPLRPCSGFPQFPPRHSTGRPLDQSGNQFPTASGTMRSDSPDRGPNRYARTPRIPIDFPLQLQERGHDAIRGWKQASSPGGVPCLSAGGQPRRGPRHFGFGRWSLEESWPLRGADQRCIVQYDAPASHVSARGALRWSWAGTTEDFYVRPTREPPQDVCGPCTRRQSGP